MELRAFWEPLRRRWWLVVVPVAIVAIYAAATYAPPAPRYHVVIRYSAGTTPALTSADYDRYYPWLTSEYVANGLADVALTGVFAEAVAARLANEGLDVAAPAVQQAIVSDNAQSILVLYLTWPDRAGAEALADAINGELTANSAAYFPQLEGVEPAVRPLDRPSPALVAAGLRSQLLGPGIKIAVALVAGVALALLWHYLDPTIRTPAEVEDIGLPVIAAIPRR
jgi:capsular polysaccharide biosynthesis protein